MMTFDDFDISENVLKAIGEMGFKKTTPIQEIAIPLELDARDITAQAQTGSGKTVAFTIPILEKIFIEDRSPQAIILCPTRELCIQVAGVIDDVGKYVKKLKCLAVYGGQPIGKQTRVLKKGVHIVVGTPGRVIDHIERGNLELIGIETVVLDEADEMLDMGFRDDIERILKDTPHQRQTLLFSATIPTEIKKIAKNYQKNPKFIKIDSNRKTTPKITQYAFKTNHKYKFDDLCKIFEAYNVKSALIFCNTKTGVDFVFKNLKKSAYSVEALHGDMSQKTRDRVMNKFRNGNVRFLAATDVAARGLDINNLDVIVNYDVPQNIDSYTHRIGRTARAGNAGFAYTLVTKQDQHAFNNIKSKVKNTEKRVPSDSEIEAIKDRAIMDKVRDSVKNDDLKKYLKIVKENTSKNLSSDEMAASLLKMMRES